METKASQYKERLSSLREWLVVPHFTCRESVNASTSTVCKLDQSPGHLAEDSSLVSGV